MPLSRAHRKADMPTRSRTEFDTQDEWISYVRSCVLAADRDYVLAGGRTELFKSFFELRKQAFPVEYVQELGRIQTLSEPLRTVSLERLNDRIFASLTQLLFHKSQPERTEAVADALVSPQEQAQELLNHLTEKNPYFALWVDYKRGLADNVDIQDWDQYLCRQLESAEEDAIAFTKAMAVLDKLLHYFRDHSMPLPHYFYERAWFLHHLRGTERMIQTRTLLNTLVTEIGKCTFA